MTLVSSIVAVAQKYLKCLSYFAVSLCVSSVWLCVNQCCSLLSHYMYIFMYMYNLITLFLYVLAVFLCMNVLYIQIHPDPSGWFFFCVFVCLCKNTPKLTFLPQNGRSRISPLLNLEKHGDRKRDRERTAAERKQKKCLKRRWKLPGCLLPPGLTWKKKERKDKDSQTPGKPWKRGNKNERRRGRGRDMCGAPKGTLTFEAEALEQAVALTS